MIAGYQYTTPQCTFTPPRRVHHIMLHGVATHHMSSGDMHFVSLRRVFSWMIHVCMHAYIHSSVRAHMRKHIHTCTLPCRSTDLGAYIRANMLGHTHTHILAYAHAYMHASSHTHTRTSHTHLLTCMREHIHASTLR